ncbi:transposase [Flavivirga aquatica]|uniref:transposase n=1 Tax=Flavivirga aquatica TaxID=1849968 RepID=UPI001F0A7314|nr:transposase [Flavivirga aquatica]
MDGSHFTWEVEGVDTLIFEAYLKAFSQHNPEELKIVIIDNAGFHSTKNINLPDNIKLIRIPPYSPELNPCEKVWQYLKEQFKNKTFDNIKELKLWLNKTVKTEINNENIISIVKSEFYINTFKDCFKL